ncbi:hypothetical protein LTR53_017057 [Teratosphaeriaceae sp. CCFEE 6253]|nr:hypothetical protein LTR53_017057 [Teratosphaeriaceae sp. CCFEE 6253]
MPTGMGNRNPWSEEEKLYVMCQIIEKAGAVPWDDIKLPEDRTLKAARTMINNEKEKALKLKGDGSAAAPASAASKKRSAANKDDSEKPEKKAKAPRKMKIKAGESDGAGKGGGQELVKAEPAGDDDDAFD